VLRYLRSRNRRLWRILPEGGLFNFLKNTTRVHQASLTLSLLLPKLCQSLRGGSSLLQLLFIEGIKMKHL
jgi:hypothetical protein